MTPRRTARSKIPTSRWSCWSTKTRRRRPRSSRPRFRTINGRPIVGQRSYGKGSVQNIIDLDGGNSVLKLTVASYYRPSGENIHRFQNAKTTDKWGVSPDPGMEVKLHSREFMHAGSSARARTRPGMLAAKGHRKPAEPRITDRDEARRPPATTKRKAEADQTPKEGSRRKAQPKPKSAPASTAPFVDKQLDKALEVIRARTRRAKAKAAI